ncbi:flagellin domain protein [Methylobacterium sp. 4-46]|uniref:flagellin N-terminal helical domain-containing protein n=1 Tax=unclassified Methylobacterium TaxID=2615210 RepID=UPI000152E44E|nr:MULTISPECIES: flagellin [Methylobacterium]ACA19463.1 flagellin domain protein [Methylobacterium sp. 4-46]WFT78662.1 flagellin [Methylobacterium nodulans]
MTSLLTNSAAMTALTTLKSINTQLDTTSNRVSTGQRVSNAADNAAYWSIATTIRTDNSSLGAVKDSLGLGASTVDTAYNGLNSILTDLQNIRAKLQTATQAGVDRAKVQTEIAALQSKMKATANSSVSSGQNWISVDSSASDYQAIRKIVAGFSRGSNGAINFSYVNVDVGSIKLLDANAGSSVTVAATQAQASGTTSLTGTTAFTGGTADFSAAQTVELTITTETGNATIKLDKAALTTAAKDLTKVTTNEFLSALNNAISASTLTTAGVPSVTASLDSAGRLTFTRSATGATNTLKIDTTANNTVDIGFGAASVTGVVNKGTNATTTTGKGLLDTATGTYTAGGGMSGSYSVANFDISKLVGTNGDTDVANIITMVDQVIGKVTDAGTKLGAAKTQVDGQKTFVDTLMKANSATIGTLVDSDIEEESTKLKALQTQQQLAVQSLSIANSSSQNLLSLFR